MVRIMALGLVVSLAACDELFDPADDGRLAPDQFVFSSSATVGAYHDIFVFDPISGARNITNTPLVDEYGPVISPDRRRIAFVRNEGTDHDLYVINVDGTGLTAVLQRPVNDVHPAWSPDGSSLLFVSTGGISIVNVTTKAIEPVRLPVEEFPGYMWPDWSPDGTTIVFNQNADIFIADVSGANRRRLVSGYRPRFSPDGGRIVFSIGNDIAVMNIDETNIRFLTDDATQDNDPDWSPDGRLIIFRSSRPGEEDLYSFRVNGGEIRTLYAAPGWQGFPSW